LHSLAAAMAPPRLRVSPARLWPPRLHRRFHRSHILRPGVVAALALALVAVAWSRFARSASGRAESSPADLSFLPGPGRSGGSSCDARGSRPASSVSAVEHLCDRREVLLASLAPIFGAPLAASAAPLWRALPPMESGIGPYPERFVAYLTRFLLNFDDDFRQLWAADEDEGGLRSQFESPEMKRVSKFGRYSRTVELALSKYSPGSASNGGASALLKRLAAAFGTSFDARRQLCILFGFLGASQPTQLLRSLMLAVENATVVRVEILDAGLLEMPGPTVAAVAENVTAVGETASMSGGALAAQASVEPRAVPEPRLELAAPPVGEGGKSARLVCKLAPADGNAFSFKVKSVEVVENGCGYASFVDLSPRLDVSGSGLVVRRAPTFRVLLQRPSTAESDKSKKTTLPGTLSRKLTALVPSDLLPTYSTSLGRFVTNAALPDAATQEAGELDKVFGNDQQLDRFRASFVFAEFDPNWGPIGISPLERERKLQRNDYLRLAVSGALASLTKELVFLPIKNVKIRLQTDASLTGGITGALPTLLRNEPIQNLFRGVDVGGIGAFVAGLTCFGLTEYLKRAGLAAFPGVNELVILAAASAVAVVFASMVHVPFETLLTQVVAGQPASARAVPSTPLSFFQGLFGGAGAAIVTPPPHRSFWGLQALGELAKAKGFDTFQELFGEYVLFCSKELAFTVTKFVIFDSLREGVLFLLPSFAEAQSLLVACACGAIAGAAAAVISHPIDTLFALKASGGEGATEGGLPGLDKLFRGVGPRILIYSPGIALQFLVYDLARTYLGVGAGSLLQTLDILAVPQT